MAPAFRCGVCHAKADTEEEIRAHVDAHVKTQRVLDAIVAEKARSAARGRARGILRARAEREAKGSAENAELRARALDLKRRRGLSWRAVARHLRISRSRLSRLRAAKR